jgi:hypothetical protein
MKEDKCIVLGCRNKKAEGMNFCKNCYTYLKTGSKNNSKACKNDILNITYMDNLTLIDNELNSLYEINKGQIEMNL